MDLLSDIFKNSGIQKRILNQRSTDYQWSYTFPCNKSIGFHIVTSGEAYLTQADRSEALLLKRGDIAFMARGVQHQLSTHPEIQIKNENSSEFALEQTLNLVSGAYSFVNAPLHPFFKELPQWIVIRYDSIQRFSPIHQYLQLLELETAQNHMGSEVIISSLLDVLFHLILRRLIEEKALSPSNWCHASTDPQIGKILELMHEKPEWNWSLEELAAHGGLSRAAFALKLKKTLGDSPLHYLTTLRIQKAMELLRNTSQNLEWVSDQVGYADAFSFSKSFKKMLGLSPKEFRIQQNTLLLD